MPTDPEDLATKWHCDKEATTTREVAGKFCTFKAGEVVRVLWDDGLTCCIERRPWDGQLPLCNQLAGVPRMFLLIELPPPPFDPAAVIAAQKHNHETPFKLD